MLLQIQKTVAPVDAPVPTAGLRRFTKLDTCIFTYRLRENGVLVSNVLVNPELATLDVVVVNAAPIPQSASRSLTPGAFGALVGRGAHPARIGCSARLATGCVSRSQGSTRRADDGQQPGALRTDRGLAGAPPSQVVAPPRHHQDDFQRLR